MTVKSKLHTDACLAARRVGYRCSCYEKTFAGFVIRIVIGLFLCLSLSLMAGPPEFDVASVKRNTSNGPSDFAPRHEGTLVTMHNVLVGSMILYAYSAEQYQVAGGDQKLRLPDGWNWYDVDARVTGDASDEEIRLMFQSLLASRFGLKIHRATQSVTGYLLRAGKNRVTPKPKVPSRPASPVLPACPSGRLA
jgi:uncharacterized protein (TIGR03435 family)